MEWCCARCGIAATADDWSLLMSMGWRVAVNGEMRCVICVRKELERFAAGPRVRDVDERRGRRELR